MSTEKKDHTISILSLLPEEFKARLKTELLQEIEEEKKKLKNEKPTDEEIDRILKNIM